MRVRSHIAWLGALTLTIACAPSTPGTSSGTGDESAGETGTGGTSAEGGSDDGATMGTSATESTGDGDGGDGDGTTASGDGDGTTSGDGDGTGGDGDGTGGDGDGSCEPDGVGCGENFECCGGFCYAELSGGSLASVCQSTCIGPGVVAACTDDADCCGDGSCQPFGQFNRCVFGDGDGDGDGDGTSGDGDGDGTCAATGTQCDQNATCCGGFCYATFNGGPSIAPTCQDACITQGQLAMCDEDDDCCGDAPCNMQVDPPRCDFAGGTCDPAGSFCDPSNDTCCAPAVCTPGPQGGARCQ